MTSKKEKIQFELGDEAQIRKLEYIQQKKRIQKFAFFLPYEALRFHRRHIEKVKEFVGVLLLIDIANIPKAIDTSYQDGLQEVYKLTIHFNAYLGSIIETLMHYGGDIMSIFGSEFVTLWKARSNKHMFDILHNAVVCANVILKLLGTYDTNVNVTLKIRIAISCGNISFGFIGNEDNRRWIMVGDAINTLKLTDSHKVYGDVFVSPEVWAHMMEDRYEMQVVHWGFVKINRIDSKYNEIDRMAYYEEKYKGVIDLLEKHIQYRNDLFSLRKGDKARAYKLYQQLIKDLPVRTEVKLASKYWYLEDMKALIPEVVYNQITESQPLEYLTEMREVTTLIIKLVPGITDGVETIEFTSKCHEIINRNMEGRFAIINNVSTTEEGVWFKILFGLRIINHENESLNALRASAAIRTDIKEISNKVHLSFGISNGLVYCSALGHSFRKEYSVIGRSAYRARSLASIFENKITCDSHIFQTSKLASFYFKKLDLPADQQNTLQGLSVSKNLIFEFNENFEVPEVGQRGTELIDRFEEIHMISSMLENPSSVPFTGVCLVGPTMIGKTAVLTRVSEVLAAEDDCIRAFAYPHEKTDIPYYTITRIHSQIYDQICLLFNENLSSIHDLPRDLVNYHVFQYISSNQYENSLIKCTALSNFRTLINSTESTIVIFIDNVQFIDAQSWEILDAVIPQDNLRLLLAADFAPNDTDLINSITFNRHIRIKELRRIRDKYLGQLICQILNVEAVPHKLIQLLAPACDGIPGRVDISLLRLFRTDSLILKISDKYEIDVSKFYYRNLDSIKKRDIGFALLDFDHTRFRRKREELTMDLISMDLFDCLTPFQQLILKTSALLGSLFNRSLLVVAMSYPNKKALADALVVLFDREILECGCRYLYTQQIDNNKKCCRCHFDEDYLNTIDKSLPRYAFCKTMHFRNRIVFQVAYHRIASNQRKELHTLCAKIIEKCEHICPRCLRDPMGSFVMFFSFSEIMEYCTDKHKQFDFDVLEKADYGIYEESIRRKKVAATNLGQEPLNYAQEHPLPFLTPLTNCNCLEMLNFIYRELIYHTKRGGENAKHAFFTLKLGLVLFCIKEFKNAIMFLTESRELSLLKDRKHDFLVKEKEFRRFIVAKSSISIAACHIMDKEIASAKNFMVIALRQFNIPLVALHYKHLKPILTKSLVVNVRTLRPIKFKHILRRWELGLTLGICAKIFSTEGDWKTSKQCLAHSIYMLRSVNINIPLLMNGYCAAVDLYRQYNEMSTCRKLMKQAVKECQVRFALNNTYYLVTIVEFLITNFDIESISGKNFREALRRGHQVLHFIRSTRFLPVDYRTVQSICELSLWNCHFTSFIDNLRLLRSLLISENQKNPIVFYQTSLYCYLLTGFHIFSVEEIVAFAESYFTKHPDDDNVLLKLMIQLEYFRQGDIEEASKWEQNIEINQKFNDGRDFLKILFTFIEINLLKYYHCKTDNEFKELAKEQGKNVKELLTKLSKEGKQSNICRIYYWLFKAWYLKIKKSPGAGRLLKKSLKLSEKTECTYLLCLTKQLKSAWKGGFAFAYSGRPQVHIAYAHTYDLDKFSKFLHPFLVS